MTRKRRRLLIVSAVVVTVVAGAWRHMTPTIDPRLVGLWEFADDDGSLLWIRYDEDGHGEAFSPYEPEDRTEIRWSLKNGVLTERLWIGRSRLPWLGELWDEVCESISKKELPSGDLFAGEVVRLRIVEIGTNTIRMSVIGESEVGLLRRVTKERLGEIAAIREEMSVEQASAETNPDN